MGRELGRWQIPTFALATWRSRGGEGITSTRCLGGSGVCLARKNAEISDEPNAEKRITGTRLRGRD